MGQDRALARKHLDRRLEQIRPLADHPRPHRGWIRAIRDALGMSSADLAKRMGVAQQTVADLERSEMQDSIKLETLRRAADALDCDVAYSFVPRTSLDEAVRRQAHLKAARILTDVAHHSHLEDQSVSDEDAAAQMEDLAGSLVDRRGLWAETD